MVVSSSKGSMRLNEDAMKEWTEKFSEAEKERQKRQKEREQRRKRASRSDSRATST